VDTGSVFSGDSSRDATLKGSEWFAVESNRNAVFRADRFRRTGVDTYVAQGSLRMKGVTAPLSIPFKLKITGDRAAMEGSATIDRLAYKIGEGEFSSTAEIPAAVAIDIVVKARSIGSARR
jgi:polyisoprenoid-binding protein YceI